MFSKLTKIIEHKGWVNILILILGIFFVTPVFAQVVSIPDPPSSQRGIPLSDKSIRWEFLDNSFNESGFVLEDDFGNQIFELERSDSSYIEEINLTSNVYYNRRISSYNLSGKSVPSKSMSTTTLIRRPDDLIVKRVGKNSITISVEKDKDWNFYLHKSALGRVAQKSNNVLLANTIESSNSVVLAAAGEEEQSDENLTAYLFKNITTSESTDWINDLTHTFNDLESDKEYVFQVKARNAEGIETEFGKSINVRTLKSSEPLLDLVITSSYINGSQESNEDDVLAGIFGGDRKINVIFSLVLLTIFLTSYIFRNAIMIPQMRYGVFIIVSGIMVFLPILRVAKATNGIFFPGDLIKYKVFYRNIGTVSSVNTFLLSKVDDSFEGGMKLNGKELTKEFDGDEGHYNHEQKDALVVNLGSIKPQESGVVEFLVRLDSATPYPAILTQDVLVGYDNSEYLLKTEISSRVSRIAEGPGVAFQGGVNMNLLPRERVLRSADKLGGGKSHIIRKYEKGPVIDALGFAYRNSNGSDLFILDKEIFNGVLADTKVDRDAFISEANNFLDREEVDDRDLVQEIEIFLEEASREKILPELEISGEVQSTDEGLVVNGTVNEQDVFVDIYINGDKKSQAKSIIGGFWESVIKYEDATKFKDVKVKFIVEILAYRANFSTPTEKKFIGSVEVDLAEKLKKDDEKITYDDKIVYEPEEEIIDTPVIEILGDTLMDSFKGSLAVGKNVVTKTTEIVKESEQTVKTTFIVVTPPVLLLNHSFFHSIPYFSFYLFHFFSWLLGLFGVRKKGKSWGIVYDSVTKEPIPLSIVRLYEIIPGSNGNESKRLIQTKVTDKEGRFDFIPRVGSFYLDVSKPEYSYPSQLILKKTKSDDVYQNIYHQQKIVVKDVNSIVKFDIPLDSKTIIKGKKSGGILNVYEQIRSGLGYISKPLMFLFLFMSGMITVLNYSELNLVIFFIYIILTLLQFALTPKNLKPWGTVFDSMTGSPLKLANVSIVDAQYGRVLKSRLTDMSGRFNFIPPSGFYRVIVTKDNYRFPSEVVIKDSLYKNIYYGRKFYVDIDNQVVNIDIPLDSVYNKEKES